jgi:hypothetical protein
MLKSKFIQYILLCFIGVFSANAQLKTSVLLQSTDEDERIEISVDKSVYFPGDTVLLVIQRKDSTTTASVTPILPIEGTTLKSIGRRTYLAVIPQSVTPGLYPVSLRVTDSEGRRFRYETDCVVAVEEYQDVEQLNRYVSIIPDAGSNNIRTAVTLDREQVRNLEVLFQRDSIRLRMGPQFLRITTTVLLRDGAAAPSYERRVVTYRSHGDAKKDRAMFIQYRTAYGAYANIRPEELEQVLVPVDSLPDWAILGIHIEPDYSIKIGAVDRSNSITQYFRVRGRTIELGFSLAIPKVLYDTRADDTTQYGITSAMVRMYFISSKTGNRFPISAGIGMFGVNSPVDVGIGRGGFALSMFLDLAEMVRIINVGFTQKINFGLEVDPFLPIGRKARLLLVAQAGVSF